MNIFKDPVTFERKIDPKLLRFGLRINGREKDKKRYYVVREVVYTSEIVLNSGAKIHLIGEKSNVEKNIEAIQFLEKLTKEQKVFLKFDERKYDENNNLLYYLYLKNKTFINAHLIKNNLVDIDTSYNYMYKMKFLEYRR